jgi:hypothetical protein
MMRVVLNRTAGLVSTRRKHAAPPFPSFLFPVLVRLGARHWPPRLTICRQRSNADLVRLPTCRSYLTRPIHLPSSHST